MADADDLFHIYDGVFDGLSKHGKSDCLTVENGRICPRDFSTKLMFSTILNPERSGFARFHSDITAKDALLAERPVFTDDTSSYLIVSESKALYERGEKFQRRARNELANRHVANRIFVQSEGRFENQGVARFRTEEIASLLTMLHFRAEGYVVQAPLQTYEGVDDVVAWKSSFITELRKHRMIEYGCYVDQLRFLKSQWPLDSMEDESVNNDLILIEAESCENHAIDEGMNQLLGKEWKIHQSDKYKKGAISYRCARELYISFPADEDIDTVEDLPRFGGFEKGDWEKVGMLVWTPRKLVKKKSEDLPFDGEIIGEEIRRYEAYAKMLILSNFTEIGEIRWLLDEYGINDMKLSLAESLSKLEEAIKTDDQFLSKAIELLKDSEGTNRLRCKV